VRTVLFANKIATPVKTMTGIGRYVQELTLALAALAGPGQEYQISSPKEKGFSGRPAWLAPNVEERWVPGARKAIHLAWLTLNGPRLEQLVGDFDLLHNLHTSFPVPTRRPGVLTVHDLMPFEHPEWYPWYNPWGHRKAIAQSAKDGWSLITPTAYVKDLMVKHDLADPERVHVVYEAVEDTFRRPVADDVKAETCARYGIAPGPFLLAVGRITVRKNLVLLVDAFARADVPGLTLVLAGSPHTSSKDVVARIAHHGLEDRVRITGFVDDDDLPALLQSAAALVHPSVDEGFGIPPLEAMAGGTPVIVARAASLPEIVDDAGMLVDPYDVGAWAAAFGELTQDDRRRAELAAAGLARSTTFSWERAARETLAVYDLTLAKSAV